MMFRYYISQGSIHGGGGGGFNGEVSPPKKLSFPTNLQVIIVLLPQSVYSVLQNSCHTPGREVVKTITTIMYTHFCDIHVQNLLRGSTSPPPPPPPPNKNL